MESIIIITLFSRAKLKLRNVVHALVNGTALVKIGCVPISKCNPITPLFLLPKHLFLVQYMLKLKLKGSLHSRKEGISFLDKATLDAM
ncbi:hypothetical protein V6N13_048963 [Hibiscus sabdariffa]